MMKRIIGITMLVGLIALLVIGGVNRSISRNGESARFLTRSSSNQYQGGTQQQNGNGDQGRIARGNDSGGSALNHTVEWVTQEGAVQSSDNSLVTITLADEQMIEISGMAWAYAQEQGFTLQAGDLVRLSGFYDTLDKFEAIRVENLTNGSALQLRENSGRPMWAGKKRQG